MGSAGGGARNSAAISATWPMTAGFAAWLLPSLAGGEGLAAGVSARAICAAEGCAAGDGVAGDSTGAAFCAAGWVGWLLGVSWSPFDNQIGTAITPTKAAVSKCAELRAAEQRPARCGPCRGVAAPQQGPVRRRRSAASPPRSPHRAARCGGGGGSGSSAERSSSPAIQQPLAREHAGIRTIDGRERKAAFADLIAAIAGGSNAGSRRRTSDRRTRPFLYRPSRASDAAVLAARTSWTNSER